MTFRRAVLCGLLLSLLFLAGTAPAVDRADNSGIDTPFANPARQAV